MPKTDEVIELEDLLTYAHYHCDKCGARLKPPTLKVVGHHTENGSPYYHGYFTCPNNRWYTSGHSELIVQYKHCHLNVWDVHSGSPMGHLWEHELAEERQKEKGKR